MALRGNLVGFMRSVMKINLNPFESKISTGIISTAPKSTPLSNPVVTSKQFSFVTVNSVLEASNKFSVKFSPAPLSRKLGATRKFTDVPQEQNSDPNLSHQEKFDNDSGNEDNPSKNNGFKVGSLVGLMALFSTMVSPNEPMDKTTEQLMELLTRASKEHERNNFKLAFKLYGRAIEFLKRKKLFKELTDREYLNYMIFIHDNVAEMAYKQGNYGKAVGSYEAMMYGHGQLGLDMTTHTVVQTMIKLATVYALKKDGSNARIYYQFAIDAEEKRLAANIYDKEALRLLRMATEAFGRYLLHVGDYYDAELHLKRAIEVCREMYGEEHPHMYVLIVEYVKVKIWQREFTEAENILNKAIDSARNPEFKEMADIYHIFGRVYSKRGQTKAALEAYQKSLGIALKSKCLKRIKKAQESIVDIQFKSW